MRILTIFLLVALPATVRAQPVWSRLDDFCPDTVYSSTNTAQYADDDVIITAGQTHTPGISTLHSYIASYDYSGQLIGHKLLYSPGKYNMPVFLGTVDGATYPLTKISTNKYLLVGTEKDITTNPQHAVYQPFFYFFNRNCDSLHFQKFFHNELSFFPHSAVTDIQKNIAVCGLTNSKNLDSTYIWLAKYDSLGTPLWSRKYFGQKTGSQAFKIVSSLDSMHYIITGVTKNVSKGHDDIVIIKTNLNGDVIWYKFLPRIFPMWHDIDVAPTNDGGYAFISTLVDDPNNVYSHIYYGKLNQNGDTLWTRTFKKYQPTAHQGRQISEAENGDLVLFGYAANNGQQQNAVIRTNSSGKIKWYREYLHKDTNLFAQIAYSMSYTPNKQVVLSGYFGATATPGVFDSTGKFSWLVVSDSLGCMTPGCQAIDTMWWPTGVHNEVGNQELNISFFPNPARSMLFVNSSKSLTHSQVFFKDISGRILASNTLAADGKTFFDLQDYAAGIYILEIWHEGRRIQVSKVEHY